ncbi:RNA polymerase sigma factor [Teredinibacter turnerae]|uniref:RNA polymerase sigma factor n=1 Tax=Teredinibacter turnerae TaxID=2426 RepID=UPI001E472FC3|nr:sigma-70 family RNA polymerase sigma factor [Teredinibacter turnerae]
MLSNSSPGASPVIPPEQLVTRIEQGDTVAEHQLVVQYQRGLMLALSRKSSIDVAEDVCQETWRVVLENIRAGKVREPERLAAYVVQTGRNQLLMYFRKYPAHTGAPHEADSDLTTNETPETQLRHQRLRTAIGALLNELPQERDRELLRRFYLQEQEKGEICKSLTLTERHFHRVLHRARQRFRELWEQTEMHW